MLWNEASYNIVRQAYFLAPKDNDGGIQINDLVFNLLDTSYAQSQLMSIRRIVDTYFIEGEKGVYSLTSLLDDMKINCFLLTRGNVLKKNGTKDGLTKSEYRHKYFDNLAIKQPKSRCSDDAINPKVFDRLKEKLIGTCTDVTIYVNQYLAHAATIESREKKQSEKIRITMEHIHLAHKMICQVTNVITCLLEGINFHFLPSAAIFKEHLFEYIDRPLVNKKDFPTLEKAWSDYETETRNWGSLPLEELHLDD
ncbi:MAG: hypothetical protein JW849_02660 [Phycisphaerae bacterium]|nr:hypothetical protein [Phycisphaerae bacterium]